MISNSLVYLYTGLGHRMHVTCNDYESDVLMEEGIYKIYLSSASYCHFSSKSYLFTIHQHENGIDKKIHQLAKTHIDIFGKYSETLEEIENLGFQGNNSKDLSDLEMEIKEYKDKFGTQNYVHWASIIGVLTSIGCILISMLIIYGCYKINRRRNISKKIDELNKKFVDK